MDTFIMGFIFGFIIFAITFIIAIMIIPVWICYSIGMSNYTRRNNIKQISFNNKIKLVINVESLWKAFCDESHEFIYEIKNFNLIASLLELGDVWHTFVKYIMGLILPKNIFVSPFLWAILFLFLLPTSFKHGKRYFWYQCIRNHKNNNNLDHICNYTNH